MIVGISFQTKPRYEVLKILEMSYGIVFCEYHSHQHRYKSSSKTLLFHNIRLVWIIASMFLSMAFVGNLKSSLIRRTYTEKTQTLDEMIDKDMFVMINKVLSGFLKNSASTNAFNQRLICQVGKKDSLLRDM